MTTESKTPAVQPQSAGGFMTQAREHGLPPAVLAEQQRAKTEIEAALTIAANMPRDELKAQDAILISCQRVGLAEKSQYEYSRGGTKISGANIRLMEAIAQKWGNIEFGFRELSRYPARGNEPGESAMEAYAWDLEANTRRKVQFTVSHYDPDRRKPLLTSQRDIYEYIANQAQRRVRTCLENIIPRDVVEAACEQCDKTLKTTIKDVPAAAKRMVEAFAEHQVTQTMIEGRIQRRIEAITPAQIIGLGKIYTSIEDGMSEAADWFDMGVEEEETVTEKAKKAMREKSAAAAADPKPATATKSAPLSPPPASPPVPPVPPADPPKADAPAPQGTMAQQSSQAEKAAKAAIEKACREIGEATDPDEVKVISDAFAARVEDAGKRLVHATAGARIEELELMPPEADPPEADPAPPAPPETAEPETADYTEQVAQWLVDLDSVETIRGLKQALAAIPAVWPDDARRMIAAKIKTKIDVLLTPKQSEDG